MKNRLLNTRTLLVVYILVTIVASVHLVYIGAHSFLDKVYTDYNNYVIFKQSFFHLIQGKDLYILYPDEQWDLYKYSPTFALLFAPLSYMPDWLGLTCWNLLNVLALFQAICMLRLGDKKTALLLWFLLFEVLTSVQNSQSNILMSGLMVLAFTCFERNKLIWAALWLVLSLFVKIYGIIGCIMFLFYPGKLRFIFYTLMWTAILFVLPLTVISFPALLEQYQSWGRMMGADQAASYGWSVMGWLHIWFGLENVKAVVTIAGILLFFTPLLRRKLYENTVYKLLFLAHMLIWVIIFNHKAESATFIIAVTGVGIWYFSRPAVLWRTILLWFVFIFTCLSHTDIFPPAIRHGFIYPYHIKAFPCIVLWIVVFVELMTIKPDRHLHSPSVQ